MLRNLTLVAMACMVVCAMTSTSEARAWGRSFKVTSVVDGTEAGIAFGGFRGGKVLVHTPDGDVNGLYAETPAGLSDLGLGVSTVNGFGFDNGYAGAFNGTVIDLSLLKAGCFIVGTGLGTTGPYLYVGAAKN